MQLKRIHSFITKLTIFSYINKRTCVFIHYVNKQTIQYSYLSSGNLRDESQSHVNIQFEYYFRFNMIKRYMCSGEIYD